MAVAMRTLLSASVLALWLVLLGSTVIAAPVIRNLSVRGLQVGKTTTVVIDGVNLLPNPRVAINAPIASQQARPKATANRVEIEVTLDAGATPGFYPLYLATDEGLSAKTVVAVDHLPQQPLGAKIESLPVALHGVISGSNLLKTTFAGKAGQAIMCEVEAQRMLGKLRPVLHLYDPQGKQIAWSLPQPTLRLDTRLTATLPADGEYTVTLNDLQYAAQSPNHFRLKIGQWQYADLAFPLAVQRGKPASLRLIGGFPDKVVDLAAAPDSGQIFLPWPAAATASGQRPQVMASDIAEVIESPAPVAPYDVTTEAIAINGQLSAAGEEDKIQLKVEPGSKLRIEVFADRVGSPLDSAVRLLDDKEKVLAQNDDGPGSTDSTVDFQIPKELQTLTVAVRDAHGRGGETFVYRVVATPLNKPAAPDFVLMFDQEVGNITAGGSHLVAVRVDRRGYDGPIALDFDRLPQGVKAEGTEIAALATGAIVTLSGQAPAEATFATLRGKALQAAQPLCRIAQLEPDATPPGQGAFVSSAAPPVPRDQLALAVSAAGISLSPEWKLTSEKLVLGGKLEATAKCARPPGFDGPVRIALLTSQYLARSANPNANDNSRTLRIDQPGAVEIAADAKAQAAWDAKLAAEKVLAEAKTAHAAAEKAAADAQQSPDKLEAANKAKAAADMRVTEAEQKLATASEAAATASSAAKNELQFKIAVPPQLASAPHDLALRMELLSRDKQTVLTTAFTPVRKLSVTNPLVVRLTTDAQIAAKLDAKAGATAKLTGKLERLEGLSGPVVVSLSGLPAAIAAPRVTLKPEESDFELAVKFPPGFAAGEVRDLVLSATGKLDPKAQAENRSDDVKITIQVLPAD